MKVLRKGMIKWVIGILVVVVFAFFGFTAEVREGEYAVITRFGAVRAQVTDAGLNFKFPWPFEKVTKYDARNQYVESSPIEVLTSDQKNIILQSFAVWNVQDPLKYHNAIGNGGDPAARVDALITNATNSVLGKYELLNVVSNDEEKLCIDEIENEMLENVKFHAAELYGISVSEIGVMKIFLPEENLNAAFEKITQQRQNLITEITTESQTKAAEITYKADLEAAQTIAKAVEKAAQTDADTEKLVAKIYADAQDGEKAEKLFKFIMELDTVIKSVDGDTTLIVKKGELLDGLFSDELLQMVKEAQENTGASDSTNMESNVNE